VITYSLQKSEDLPWLAGGRMVGHMLEFPGDTAE